MKVSRVTAWGSVPETLTVAALPPPSPSQLQVRILAAGLPRVVRLRAARQHPSALHATLPFDPSIDGVGVDEATGTKYFIGAMAAPLFAEHANVERSHLVPLPSDTNPITLAGLANPVTSSWMALQHRVTGGCAGRTVAIIGATCASGRAAALVARILGARRVVGVSRNKDSLATVAGLDDAVVLDEQTLTLERPIGPVSIVLDYVGGKTSVAMMESLEIEPGQNLQYVQSGNLSGTDVMALPVVVLNKRPIYLMSSGIGSFSHEDLKAEMPALVGAIARMKPPFEILGVKMEDLGRFWGEGSRGGKMVVVP
ncbi:NAD(P)-binding protein, partial [Aspergillus ellipticus CBS 707.79]